MIERIYVEEEARTHRRTEEILRRFPDAERVACRRYGEVFNRRAQNFRLQKRRPALILAHKFANFVLETPAGYGIGGSRNFYFSHMLNCIYDCRYCFLQGMYRSAHYVVFVNYEDFLLALEKRVEEHRTQPSYFFSGYDCDSLAFDTVTRFTSCFLPFFERTERAWLELRTKSVQIKTLLGRAPHPRVVVAFSLTPEEVSAGMEHRAPPLGARLRAMRQLARRGWPIGLRFDPLIYVPRFRDSYRDLFREVFSDLPPECVHSVSLGPLRFPRGMFDAIVKLYPDEKLFAGPLEVRDGRVSYPEQWETEMHEVCRHYLSEWVDEDRLYACRGGSA